MEAVSPFSVVSRGCVVPSIDQPHCGETFKIRAHLDELSDEQLFEIVLGLGELSLDVYNPVDPPVCYVAADADRWKLKVTRFWLELGCLKFWAVWTNQQFPGLTEVEVRLGFNNYGLEEGELEFLY